MCESQAKLLFFEKISHNITVFLSFFDNFAAIYA